MRLRLVAILAALSLMMAAGAAVLWARSGNYSRPGGPDSLDLTTSEPLIWFVSDRGRLALCRQVGKDWGQPVSHFDLLGFEFASSTVGRSSLADLFIPYWMILGVTLLLPLRCGWVSYRLRRSARLGRAGRCQFCRYDLRASTGRCPECGREVASATS